MRHDHGLEALAGRQSGATGRWHGQPPRGTSPGREAMMVNVVRTKEQLDALPIGTAVRDSTQIVCEKWISGWHGASSADLSDTVVGLPAVILTPDRASTDLVAISRWIDEGNAHRDPEAATWARLAKIAEEAGEVIEAFIGSTGQNPRKGRTHEIGEVMEELLDVAVTALGAYEHLDAHRGEALSALEEKIKQVAIRAGLQ